MLGSGISALGVVRALGRAGIPLHVVDADPGLCRRSRWYSPPPADRFRAPDEALADYIRALPLERGVPIAASDHAGLAVAGLPADLRERFPASQAPPEVFRAFVDKERFRNLLETHAISHPRTFRLRTAEDADLLPDDVVDRLFVKPTDSQAFFRRMRAKAFLPRDRDDLMRTLRRVEAAGLSVVLQEYIPGPATDHWFLDGFVDRDGRPRGLLARRRLRMSPPDFGSSCATVSVPLELVQGAAHELLRLFREVGYRGMFDAEFKRDERSGTFYLIEVNVRAWWQMEFAAACGVDVVPMAYRDALGLPVPSVDRYRIGLKWLLPYQDLWAWRELFASGEAGLVDCLRSWVTSRWAGFALDDPLPGVAGAARGLEAFVRRRARRAEGGRPAALP